MIIQYIVASELKDPICHSNECQIGSFSSEATTCINKHCVFAVIMITRITDLDYPWSYIFPTSVLMTIWFNPWIIYLYFSFIWILNCWCNIQLQITMITKMCYVKTKHAKRHCFINLFTTIHDGNFRRHSSMNVTIKWHKFSSNIYYIYVFFVIWSWKLR